MSTDAYENDIKNCPKCRKLSMVFKNRASILDWLKIAIEDGAAGELTETTVESYKSLGHAWLCERCGHFEQV
jgi:hypothetical protein